MYIEYFWTLGSIFVAASAWVFLEEYDWRVLTLVTAIPVTIGLTWSIFCLPESPRWLLQQGRVEDAEKCILDMAVINNYDIPPFRLAPVKGGSTLDDSTGSAGSCDVLNPDGNGTTRESKDVSFLDFLKKDQLGILDLYIPCRLALSISYAYFNERPNSTCVDSVVCVRLCVLWNCVVCGESF